MVCDHSPVDADIAFTVDGKCPLCMERRIKELEEGSCRFNCRSKKEAFMAGWLVGHNVYNVDDPKRAYTKWLKEQRVSE